MNEISYGSAPLTASEAAALEGVQLDGRHYNQVIAEPTNVYKEDGSPLLLSRPGKLREAVCENALPALRKAAKYSENRRAPSGIMGFYGRTAREPYCRVTEFTRDEAEAWLQVQPLLRVLNDLFRDELPDRYEAQMRFVRRTDPEFVIRGTCFTTVTVNRNHSFGAHQDEGNLKLGFGVLGVLGNGGYQGCHLVFPQYRLAVALYPGDVVLFESKAWHGNSPFVSTSGEYERISVVAYYRANMIHCGTPLEEHERAKRRRPGDPLF